jgi:hypothetical protein
VAASDRQPVAAGGHDDPLANLRHAWRILRHDSATSAVILLTLTLGIAATSIMFGVVDQLLLRPTNQLSRFIV